MSAARNKADKNAAKQAQPEPRVTIDDVRHQAEALKASAVTEAKGVVDEVLGAEGTRTLIMVAGVVLVAASVAYFLGSRAGRSMTEQMLAE